ncbi:MAG: CoA-binding protein [Candidatus Woesearchaeota archaeon]
MVNLLNPRSIAVIGATDRKGSVGRGIMENLLNGAVFMTRHASPFKGHIYPVNPKAVSILGKKAYPSVNHIPGVVDLAIIAVPAKIVPEVAKECVEKKIPYAIIISAGFHEAGKEGQNLQDEVRRISRGKMRIVGPNCLGILRPGSFNGSFAPTMPPVGHVGFITQSGALADSIIDWSIEERYGFSSIISYGNAMDLDVSDFIEMLGNDSKTKVITLYIEGILNGEKFMRIASKVSKKKPIIALKAGRTSAGSKAIGSHTGSLAGNYAVYEEAFSQSGVILADTVEEMFDTAKALAHQPPLKKPLVIVTNGGGCGVLAADYCEELGVPLAVLKESTLKKLDNSGVMHPAYSRRNPLDIVGDALPERYEAALDILLSDSDVGGAIVIQTLQTMTDPVKDAQIVVKMRKKYPKKPIVCAYMGGRFSKAGILYLEEHGVPDYNDPRKAALAMRALHSR